jgi:hypothetical protein
VLCCPSVGISYSKRDEIDPKLGNTHNFDKADVGNLWQYLLMQRLDLQTKKRRHWVHSLHPEWDCGISEQKVRSMEPRYPEH